MSCQLLSQLSVSEQNQIIRVRIARMWDKIILPKRTFLGVDLLLTDVEGNGMQATIKNTDAHLLRPQVEEGSVYEILRFQVVPAKVSYNSVHRDRIISFSRRTRFYEIHENIERYPRHYFRFASIEEIDERAHVNKFLIDVIGMLIYVGPIKTVRVPETKEMISKQDVIIRLLSGEDLKVIIWQDLVREIREELLQMTPKPVLIFAGALVKCYMGDLCISTSSATKIFVDLDISETAEIKERFRDENVDVPLLPIDLQPNHPQHDVKDATLAELLAKDPTEIQHTKFHCRATIVEIDVTTGWNYNACNRCWGALRAWHGSLWCTWHGKRDPLLIMRLNLRIRDETGEMRIVIFGKLAENLTGLSVRNMTEMDLPAAAREIRNKPYILKIGLTNSAITSGVLGYKIFDFEILEPTTSSSETDASSILAKRRRAC